MFIRSGHLRWLGQWWHCPHKCCLPFEEDEGLKCICKYWVGNHIKHQHTRNVRSRGSEEDEMKKSISDCSAFLQTMPPPKPLDLFSSKPDS